MPPPPSNRKPPQPMINEFETPRPERILSAPSSPTLSSSHAAILQKQLELLERTVSTPLPQTPVARSMQSFEQQSNGNVFSFRLPCHLEVYLVLDWRDGYSKNSIRTARTQYSL
jgi:hypothetical protein